MNSWMAQAQMPRLRDKMLDQRIYLWLTNQKDRRLKDQDDALMTEKSFKLILKRYYKEVY